VTLYLDTSSLVKLYVVEPGYDIVLDQMEGASVVATSTVAYAEARAAFARRRRERVLTAAGYAEATKALNADWPFFLTMDVTMALTEAAGALAERYELRGFDSLHLATFASIARSAGPDIQFSSFDDRLNRAARRFLKARRRP
jgi:predicted nucleic acid-binding protein